MKKIIFLILISFLSLEAFKLSGKKWSGLHPVIQIEIDPFFQGIKTHQGVKFFLKDILLAVNEWNRKTGSHVNWKIGSLAVPDTKSYFDLVNADKIANDRGQSLCEVVKSGTGKIASVVSSEKDSDGDCTANSCVYVWSCGDEIVHADVTLNNSAYSWADLISDQNTFNIRSEILKILGQLSGLTSCSPGDRDSDCSKSGDPDMQSVLYKFPDFGKKEVITSDDISGIQTLYGTFNLPFPQTGPYALNDQERGIVQDLIDLENKLGYANPEGRKAIAVQLNHLAKYSEYRSKKDLKQQYDELMNIMQSQTPTLSIEGLKIQRDLLLMGIVTATKTKEDVMNGFSSMDIGFIDYTIQRHMELWRMTIDRVGEREQ
ncbi:MAG TPA: hypothetical protein PK079_10795 [Leptospiraceae bacterium]|nr:hypothetical protein [Leptospiraceae bacterium]HMW05879.1 hypothetical protein [Leptospiraceae bacterium]HMX34771.1 hypothetical protein [Leptospiraceae bacterium]HMY32756.1 hypothetical protein [Leptospiraceae bacterium]HMZ67641.1 hypothetical protein [Leptospiraceae bacterium]